MSRAVIDQPGFRILAVGLVLSLFLGLGFKNQITESRISNVLNKSIERLKSDFTIDYGGAKISLSKWGLPLPSLQISRVRFTPKGINCQNTQVFIDEIEVPISISAILGRSDKVPKIRLSNVELRLDGSDKCILQHKQTSTAVSEPSTDAENQSNSKQPLISVGDKAVSPQEKQIESEEIKEVFRRNTRAELSEIYIERLKVITRERPEQPIVLKQISIDLKYADNKLSNVNVSSKLNAIRDLKSDIYYMNANLNLIAKLDEQERVDVVLTTDGKLLDGDVQIFVHYLNGEPKVNYELSLNRVSAKALQPLINSNLHQNIELVEKLPISISFSNSGEIPLGSEEIIRTEFKKVYLIVDNAQIKSNEIKVSLEKSKFSFSPFEFWIDSMPLSRIKNSEILKDKLSSFESLGAVSGKLSYQSPDNFRFDGILRGLEVVFSNGGRRDLQIIDEMKFHFKQQAKKYSLEADSLIVEGQKVDGVFAAQHNADTKQTKAYLKLSGALLNKKVWSQFTFVEQSPKVELSWSYNRQKSEDYTLRLKTDSLELPGILFSGIVMDLSHNVGEDQSKNSLSAAIKSGRLTISEKFFQNDVVSKIISPESDLRTQILSGEKMQIGLIGEGWRNLNFNAETSLGDGRGKSNLLGVSVKGSVDSKTGMSSRVSLNHKNQMKRFEVLSLNNGELVVKPLTP